MVRLGVPEPFFFGKLAATLDGLGFFACFGQVSDTLHCTAGVWSLF